MAFLSTRPPPSLFISVITASAEKVVPDAQNISSWSDVYFFFSPSGDSDRQTASVSLQALVIACISLAVGVVLLFFSRSLQVYNKDSLSRSSPFCSSSFSFPSHLPLSLFSFLSFFSPLALSLFFVVSLTPSLHSSHSYAARV